MLGSRKFRSARYWMALGSAGALLATGCSAGGDQAAAGGDTGSTNLVVAYFGQLDTLDPVATRTQTGYVVSNIYETLVTYDDKNALQNQLAESYKVSDDATSIEFTLRDGVKFHDGSPLTAGDVKYSLERYAAVGSGVAGYLGDFKSVEVTDARHFTITLKKPNAIFLNWLTLIYILEEKAVKPNEGTDHAQAWLQNHDAGTGPYALEGMQTSGDVALKRYDGYWSFDKGRAAGITFKRIDQSATERQSLLDGSIDVAYGLTAGDADALKGSKVTVASLTSPSSDYVYLNSKNGPTANPAVRQALELAFDYQGALKNIRKGYGQVSKGLLPNSVPCGPEGSEHAQDLTKAKQVLADAGITNLKLTLNFQPVVPLATEEATLFQSNLREIGVTLDLVPIGFPDYLAKLSDPAKIPQMMLATEGVPMPEPGSALFSQYTTDTIGTTNRSAYSNPEVDRLLAQAKQTPAADARCALYTQAEKLILQDRPVLNLMTINALVGYREGITGVALNPTARPIRASDLRVG